MTGDKIKMESGWFKVDKLFNDMYLGDGKESPSMTTRMSIVEERLEKLTGILNQMTKVVIGVIVAIIAQIVLKLLHIL